ncbi:ATP-binding protein [Heyndrickxia sp. FSL K6-6286]|uniref:ATP-binding protein n=1 Tax=Heyndrickxia sp. FSL K6-6286 TaxID=2921510 RepID=UPI00315AD3B7
MEKLNDQFSQILSNLQEKYGSIEQKRTESFEVLDEVSDKCPYKQCDGSGYIVFKELGEVKMAICECRQDKELLTKFKFAKIPIDLQDCTVKEFRTDIYRVEENRMKAEFAKRVASEFTENFHEFKDHGKGLYLYSKTTGSGKSRLAVSIANDIIRRFDINVLYISSANMLNELKNTFDNKNGIRELDISNYYGNVEVLIIDDFGVEKASDWSESIFTQILEERMNNKKVTILTSNLSVEELSGKYPAGRIQGRIEKITFPLAMPEESVRSILAAEENEGIFEKIFGV